ncbi:bacterial transcriptional activator domain-containing protein, partial [Rhodoferax sp.]|uniref:bacterial transcriptional activator domain-containing protein n=1 Tax=Rhodoferax sp. TaxID=50421 RepID=UPI00271AE478
ASDCDPASRLALLELALTLYQGEYLAGEDELPDVLVARQRLQTWFSRQVGAQGAWLEAQGQFDAAVRLYRRVIEQQPLAEAIYRRLIRCLLELGQRAEAYEVYRRCRQQLSIVLGIRTAPETDALVATLRNL